MDLNLNFNLELDLDLDYRIDFNVREGRRGYEENCYQKMYYTIILIFDVLHEMFLGRGILVLFWLLEKVTLRLESII